MSFRVTLFLFAFASIASGQTRDPAKSIGETTRESVEAHERWAKASKSKLDREFQQFHDVVKSIDEHTLRAETQALALLKVIVPKLRAQGEIVFLASNDYVDAMGAYRGELAAAKAVFLDISRRSAKRADSQKYDDLRALYLQTSQIFKALARKSQRRSITVQQDLKMLADGSDYVKELVSFLRHFEDGLRTIPEFPAGESIEDVIAATQQFVKNFEKLRSSMKMLHGKLDAGKDEKR